MVRRVSSALWGNFLVIQTLWNVKIVSMAHPRSRFVSKARKSGEKTYREILGNLSQLRRSLLIESRFLLTRSYQYFDARCARSLIIDFSRPNHGAIAISCLFFKGFSCFFFFFFLSKRWLDTRNETNEKNLGSLISAKRRGMSSGWNLVVKSGRCRARLQYSSQFSSDACSTDEQVLLNKIAFRENVRKNGRGKGLPRRLKPGIEYLGAITKNRYLEEYIGIEKSEQFQTESNFV